MEYYVWHEALSGVKEFLTVMGSGVSEILKDQKSNEQNLIMTNQNSEAVENFLPNFEKYLSVLAKPTSEYRW